jgi:hypothetical protein
MKAEIKKLIVSLITPINILFIIVVQHQLGISSELSKNKFVMILLTWEDEKQIRHKKHRIKKMDQKFMYRLKGR